MITAAGPSLREFDPVRFCCDARGLMVTVALAGGLRAWARAGIRPDIWIVTDAPIVREYRDDVIPGQLIIAGRQAAQELTNYPIDDTMLYTFNTMDEPRHYSNGYQVYSRGTCAIAAMMVMLFIGVRSQYILGMDCARTRDLYHYDGRRHPVASEQCPRNPKTFADGCWTTPHIDRMRDKLIVAWNHDLFDDIVVTTVGHTHQPIAAFRNITYPEFYEECKRHGFRKTT